MDNKIHIPYYKVLNTIYIVVRDNVGKVWDTISKSFVTWVDVDVGKYAINSIYSEGSLHTASFPVDIANGYYSVMAFLQSGVSPVVDSDIWIGSLNSYWDKDNKNLFSVRVDSLIEYSEGQRFSSKALEQAGGGDGVTIIERTPKVQVKSTKNVETVQVPAEIEVLPDSTQRESSAIITDEVVRKSSTKVGP